MHEVKRTPTGGCGQDWPAYHAAQLNEKPHFIRLLKELCRDIEEPEHLTGRLPLCVRDMLFCLIYKVYSTFSSRRIAHDLLEAKDKSQVDGAPSANSLSEYMRKESLTSILQQLVVKSSLPLVQVENTFAADSTGLQLPRRRRWFNRHKGRLEMKRDHLKLHVICGVRTNIITYAEVSAGTEHDSPYFRGLVERTAQYFEMSEVSADAGYISGENMRAVVLVGGEPYIAFRKNCVLDGDYKSTYWKDMLYLYKSRNVEYMGHYYLRNNVEATFSALKAKFNGRLRSKSWTGQINEALCKVLCHNLCALIQSMFELQIDPTDWSKAKLTPRAKDGLIGKAMSKAESKRMRHRIAAASGNVITQAELFEDKKKHVAKRKKKPPDPDQISLFD